MPKKPLPPAFPNDLKLHLELIVIGLDARAHFSRWQLFHVACQFLCLWVTCFPLGVGGGCGGDDMPSPRTRSAADPVRYEDRSLNINVAYTEDSEDTEDGPSWASRDGNLFLDLLSLQLVTTTLKRLSIESSTRANVWFFKECIRRS